jgi:hypothetical protein
MESPSNNNYNNINYLLDNSLNNYSSAEYNLNNGEELSESNNYNIRNFDTQLDEIFDQLTYAIRNEKQNLKNDKLVFLKEKQKFLEFKNSEKMKLEKEKDQFKENLKIIESVNIKDSDILDLDVGGTQKITTLRSTLLKYPNSALAAMFSGKYEIAKHNERHFIDRDGSSFVYMINFLRNSKIPNFKDKPEEASFYEELEFWQIPYKDEAINKIQNFFDPEWYANTLILEYNNTTVKKHNLQHGIVFCKNNMSATNPYVEFNITMNIPSRGKSHLFIGLVDKTKYKYEMIISTFWKDSPSSYYWDVWNTKLIKTDDNGIQVGSVSGYGCLCEDYETKIGIKYDSKNRSVSFYKNGINQGIAFRNVPSGLTPSLDIWFESGTIEIMKNSTVVEKTYI